MLADIPAGLEVSQGRIDNFKELCASLQLPMQRALLLTICGVGEWSCGVADLYYIDADFVYDALSDDVLYDDFKTEANLHIKAYKLAKRRNYPPRSANKERRELISEAEAYTMIRRGIPDDVIVNTFSRAEIQAKYPNAFRPVEDAWAERFGF